MLDSKVKHFNRFKHANFFYHLDIIDAYLSYLPIDEKVILKLKITFVLYANRVIRINIKFMKIYEIYYNYIRKIAITNGIYSRSFSKPAEFL